MTIEQLEAKIYDKFYDENPEGDARSNGLWKEVIDAKKADDPIKALQGVLACVAFKLY